MDEKKKTSLGMDENIEGALCYVLGFITGIVFFVLEKDSKFVRFHAMQSIATFLPLMVIGYLIGSLAIWSWSMLWFFGMISTLIWILELILWIVLMLKAYQGEMFKLPIVGDFAEKQVK
ncbi:MAG: DUF4870 domain-containing protein [Candidatus Methanoperedens sp.]|nr:DUF4870 domain-containing protein [Candidatus Methanoperedens sp.]MCZ7359967.1 DUF4870 domain-containing protein [Candidatus Methanoperedens sp.]HLB72158.1 DUF4870 domain-containing protein [Candidatus Methanoperedens sp.]